MLHYLLFPTIQRWEVAGKSTISPTIFWGGGNWSSLGRVSCECRRRAWNPHSVMPMPRSSCCSLVPRILDQILFLWHFTPCYEPHITRLPNSQDCWDIKEILTQMYLLNNETIQMYYCFVFNAMLCPHEIINHWYLGVDHLLNISVIIFKYSLEYSRLPLWLSWSRICLQCERPRFDPWVGKIPWIREWPPTPSILAWRIPQSV